MFEFYKYHAIGNDYIVIDPSSIDFDINPDFIKKICTTHTGIGADGVLVGPYSKDGTLHSLSIFNSDGSEAECSGNGIRIFAYHLYSQKYVHKKNFEIQVAAGILQASILDFDKREIGLCIGKYKNFCTTYKLHRFFISGESIDAHYINLGNPHLVVFLDRLPIEKARRIGSRISNSRSFAKQTNVQVVTAVNETSITIEIWERGSGYTLSSGTSSVAASCIARKMDLISSRVDVKMPGGKLIVEFANNDDVLLQGSITPIFTGKCLLS